MNRRRSTWLLDHDLTLVNGRHGQVRRVSWSRAITGMVTAGVLLCLLGWALIPALLTPARAEYPPRMVVAVPVSTPEPTATPEPDLEPAVVDMARVTEEITASQAGDGSPATYSVPRIMQAGIVKVQLTSVLASHPNRGYEEVEQSRQAFRFELIDALDRSVLGSVDITREEGVDAPPVVLATLTEPRATYMRVSADVRGDGTCVGCGNADDFYDRPLFHTWTALLQYMRAG